MNDQSEKTKAIAQLLLSQNQNLSINSRLSRWIIFKLGFSKCKYCIYCNFEGNRYRGVRESMMLVEGKCHWSVDSTSSDLNSEDLERYHRCPAFVPILYNFKDYGIDPREIERIRGRRSQFFVTWAGWIVAILIAISSKLLD